MSQIFHFIFNEISMVAKNAKVRLPRKKNPDIRYHLEKKSRKDMKNLYIVYQLSRGWGIDRGSFSIGRVLNDKD
jgi:hypothetical protein